MKKLVASALLMSFGSAIMAMEIESSKQDPWENAQQWQLARSDKISQFADPNLQQSWANLWPGMRNAIEHAKVENGQLRLADASKSFFEKALKDYEDNVLANKKKSKSSNYLFLGAYGLGCASTIVAMTVWVWWQNKK